MSTADETIKATPPKTRAVEGILWYIGSRGMEGGDRLPSERDLSLELGVSRTALRAAISQLESRFVLESRQGSGTHVCARKPTFVLEETCSFSEAVRRAGRVPSSRLVHARVHATDERSARKMGAAAPGSVLEIRRVRLVDGAPASIETAYVNNDRYPELARVDFAHESLYACLERAYGVRLAHGTDRISITRVRADEARLLEVACGTPAFFQETVGYDEEGGLIEYCASVVLPSKVQIASTGGAPRFERW